MAIPSNTYAFATGPNAELVSGGLVARYVQNKHIRRPRLAIITSEKPTEVQDQRGRHVALRVDDPHQLVLLDWFNQPWIEGRGDGAKVLAASAHRDHGRPYIGAPTGNGSCLVTVTTGLHGGIPAEGLSQIHPHGVFSFDTALLEDDNILAESDAATVAAQLPPYKRISWAGFGEKIDVADVGRMPAAKRSLISMPLGSQFLVADIDGSVLRMVCERDGLRLVDAPSKAREHVNTVFADQRAAAARRKAKREAAEAAAPMDGSPE